MSDDNHEEPVNMEPQVLIDQSILARIGNLTNNQNISSNPAYSVNNTTFYCDDRQSNDDYVHFELYAEKLTNLANRQLFVVRDDEDTDSNVIYCSTPDTSEDGGTGDEDEEMKIVLRTTPDGVLINSDVFLSHKQWNTIVDLKPGLVKCVVCELWIDDTSSTIHMRGELHNEQLDKFKPLAKFDLSIIRKIRDNYHCAVCNETFSLDSYTYHCATKSHEGRLLSALNKVSEVDLIFNNDSANSNNEYHNIYNSFQDRNRNNDGNIVTSQPIRLVRKNSSSTETDSEYDSDDEDDKDGFWETEDNAESGNSYATMLKKPKLIEIPLFLEKDLGNKKVKVKFDSWHMLISPKVNRFYCMVCKEFGHVRCKADHCVEYSHLENLNKCNIITRFGDYLIREVDDKYCHCGHCNNLVIISYVKEHIEKYHSTYNKHAGDNTKIASKNSDNDGNAFNDNATVNNGASKTSASQIACTDKENNINLKNKKDGDFSTINKVLYENVIITPFGYDIKIPVQSFNVICKRPSDYYCGLCNVLFAESMLVQHIYGLPHLQLLQRTPFILPFSFHLIRGIREALHCAICNLPVAANAIYIHINEQQHMQLLANALTVDQPPNNANTSNPNTQDPDITAVHNTKNLDSESTKQIETTETANAVEIDATELYNEQLTEDESAGCVDLDESLDSELDLDEYVYVKLKNTFYRISVISYNSLVHLGDSKRYCFVCSSKVDEEEMKKHIECRLHSENMAKCKFLDRDDILLRQIFLTYHCSTCNVLVSRKELKNHSVWQTHLDEVASIRNISKKMRKNDIKAGINIYIAITQKEVIYLNERETETRLLFKVKITDKKHVTLVKKMKILIVKGDVLKINFDNWNGVVKVKDCVKCLLCQFEFNDEELHSHVLTECHIDYMNSSTFNEEYLTDLMREINNTTLHCMICNTEVSNKDFIVKEHVYGKKHKKNYDIIRNVSSTTNAYTDCEEEVLQL